MTPTKATLLLLVAGILIDINTGAAADTNAVAAEAGVEVARSAFLREAYDRHFVPLAARFRQTAPRLVAQIESLCASPTATMLDQARSAWVDTMLAWEAIDAIEVGPLLDRRSTFRIDFWPTRPRELESILRDPPRQSALLDRVNAPAKGLPAIEVLLWSPAQTPAAIASPKSCDYAHVLASGVRDEAEALDQAFRQLAAGDVRGTGIDKAFSALINQTFGAVERLRGKYMLTPARLNNGKHFPRVLSGQTAPAWQARWASIRGLLTGGPQDRTARIEVFLHAQGEAAAAAALSEATQRAAIAMQRVVEATPATAEMAGAGLAELETVLGGDVATALKVTIGFHAYDGD